MYGVSFGLDIQCDFGNDVGVLSSKAEKHNFHA